MKSLRNKVIMSAIVLVFAVIATIGSTYAWFTVSTEVSVSGIDLNVQSDESLLIQLDDGYSAGTAQVLDANNYGITVTSSDLSGSTTYGTMSTWTMGTVTAGFGNDDGNDLAYTGLLNGSGDLALRTMDINAKTHTPTSSANSSTGDYVTVKFWLLSQSSTTEDVVLQDLSITGAGGNQSGQNAVVNAIRIATDDGTVNDNIFSIDPDYGFTFGSGDPGYDGVNTWENELDDTPTTGVQATLVGAHSLWYDSVDAAVSNVSAGSLGAADVVTTLANDGTPTLVTVYIYIEGWDAQATTDILNAGFSISFKFALQDVA